MGADGPGGLDWTSALTGDAAAPTTVGACGCHEPDTCGSAGGSAPSSADVSSPPVAPMQVTAWAKRHARTFLRDAEDEGWPVGAGSRGPQTLRRSDAPGSTAKEVGYDKDSGGSSGESWFPGEQEAEADAQAESTPTPENTGGVIQASVCITTRSVLTRDMAKLAKVCSISFGASTRWASLPTLSYSLDAEYTGMASKHDVWNRYIPDWVARRELKFSKAAELIADDSGHAGLFWEDDFLVGAVKFALVTLHSYADLASEVQTFSVPCGVEKARWIRDPIANGGWTWTNKRFDWEASLVRATPSCWSIWFHTQADIFASASQPLGCEPGAEGSISVASDGQVSVSFPTDSAGQQVSTRAAVSPGWFVTTIPVVGNVWLTWTGLCEVAWMNAALADYFFWWAGRLLAWHRETGDPDADRMASVCARAAMAEIAELSGLLLHELTHMTGPLWQEDTDGSVGGGCLNCCHYMLNIVMRDRLMAQFGTPEPMAMTGLLIPPAKGTGSRFDYAEFDTFQWSQAIKAGDSCAINWQSTRPSFWNQSGLVNVSYNASPSVCWDTTIDLGSTDVISSPGQNAGTSR